MLRTTDASSETVVGNLYLDKLCGAHIHWVSPEQYAEREQRMKEIAEDLDRAGRCVFIIPEGGSNALGSLGYVRAMREVREQLSSAQGERAETLPESFDAIVHACGSGGTAAGVGIGAAACQIAEQLHAVAVCDNTQYFEGIIAALRSDMKDLASDLPPSIPTRVHDQFMGPGYGISSPEQLSFLQQVACRTGLVLDPVYSGKALYALAKDQAHMKVRGQRILFIHTGGLPGLLAQASTP